MKKTLATTLVAVAVVLLTATFSFAEYATAGVANFPFFQLGCLILGGLIMVSLKRKYERCMSVKWLVCLIWSSKNGHLVKLL